MTQDWSPEPDMQLCRVCREEKFLTEFQADGKGGLRPECRTCCNYQRVVWAHSTPERHARALKMRQEYTERRKQAPGQHSEAEWEARLVSYAHRCAYCGTNRRALVKEHVIPVSAGGTNDIANLVPACQPCNARKLDRLDFPPPNPPLYPPHPASVGEPPLPASGHLLPPGEKARDGAAVPRSSPLPGAGEGARQGG